MEDALAPNESYFEDYKGLNPCFNGRCTRTTIYVTIKAHYCES